MSLDKRWQSEVNETYIIMVEDSLGTFKRLYTAHKIWPSAVFVLDSTRKEIDTDYVDWLRGLENV